MHPKLRELLKRVLLLKSQHHNPEYLTKITRQELAKNKHLTDEREILKAISYGKWMIREEEGRVRFKQYRELRKRYG